VPTAQEILAALTDLAHQWWGLAAFWHLWITAFGAALILKWRPDKRTAVLILAAPLTSVAALALVSGNPFTSLLVGALLVAWVTVGLRRTGAVAPAGTGELMVGTATVLFGLVYPHFLDAASVITYVYASPVGIVPCPTLSVLVGYSLILNSMGSRFLGLTVASAGIFYGAFGVIRLGVTLDGFLLAGALVLLVVPALPASFDAGQCRPTRRTGHSAPMSYLTYPNRLVRFLQAWHLRTMRLGRLLKRRGVDAAAFVRAFPIVEIESQIASCHRCERKPLCDRALDSSAPGKSRYSFCPNTRFVDSYRLSRRG
jgi:hypothetical protein